MKTTPILLIACALIRFTESYGQMVDVNRTIPDNDANGLVSTLDVTTSISSIDAITITLNISSAAGDSAWNGDLYAYITHDSGASTGFTVLLNRVGVTASSSEGYGDHGFSVTLSDSAANDIHTYQSSPHSFDSNGRLIDLWKPDARNISPTSSGSAFDAASRSADFSSFSGLNPNGLWVLFISDRAAGNVATLDNWSLSITSVPEPKQTTIAVAFVLLGSALGVRLRRSLSSRATDHTARSPG